MKIKIFSIALVTGMTIASALMAQEFLAKKEVRLGKKVADFALPDSSGKVHKLSDYRGKIVVIHFWSAECPFVVRYENRIKEITNLYKNKDVVVLGIDSNATESRGQISRAIQQRAINYTVLMDQDSKIADRFGAITTPHVYILNRKGRLLYEGAFDDQGWAARNPVKTPYVREVLDAMIAKKTVPFSETKTYGCTVKREKEKAS